MRIPMIVKSAVKTGLMASAFFAVLGTFQAGQKIRAMILSGNPLNRG